MYCLYAQGENNSYPIKLLGTVTAKLFLPLHCLDPFFQYKTLQANNTHSSNIVLQPGKGTTPMFEGQVTRLLDSKRGFCQSNE